MVCKKCGKEFTEKYSKWSNGDFCSQKCARSFSSKQNKQGTKIVHCIDCGKEIEVDKRASPKLCKCDDCRGYKKIENNFCYHCGKPVIMKCYKFCSKKCRFDFKYKSFINDWKCGKRDGFVGKNKDLSNYVRRYILEKFENKCSKCGWHEVNKFTKSIPLEIHHIDGNFQNNNEENLTLLCPNCHSLTEFHSTKKREKNIGRRKYKKALVIQLEE